MTEALLSAFLVDENLMKAMECPICMQIYEDPKSLQCGHSLCAGCVKNLPRETSLGIRYGPLPNSCGLLGSRETCLGAPLQCPVCRQVTRVPEGGLRTNFVLQSVISRVHELQAQTSTRAAPCQPKASEEITVCATPFVVQPVNERQTKRNVIGSGSGTAQLHNDRSDDWDHGCESFEDMGLQERLLYGIHAFGFGRPSAIQQRAIVPCKLKLDVIVQEQSGIDRMVTLSVSVLQNIDKRIPEVQALVLVPNREIAQEIQKVVVALGKYMGVTCHTFIGGTSVHEDQRKLESGVHVVVGTPGRVNNMIRRQALQTRSIKMFVIDEADDMFSHGFNNEVYEVFNCMRSNVQVVLLSTTMPSEVRKVTGRFMKNPVRVLAKKEEPALKGVKQFYINAEKEKWKFGTLRDLCAKVDITNAVILCGTRQKADNLKERLREENYEITCMYRLGETEKLQQSDIMLHKFLSGPSRVFTTTDLVDCGIDVQQISFVINYDVPWHHEEYVRRIERSGGAGGKGVAINFVVKADMRDLKNIESFCNTQIEEVPSDIATLVRA